MMRRFARHHESIAAQRLAGTDATAYAFAQPGDHVRTVDGLGIVADVYPGPVPGGESYYVVLDDGLGEGEYSGDQVLDIVPDEMTITARRYSQVPMACDVCGAPAHKSRSGGVGGHTMLCPDCENERDRQKTSIEVSSSRGPDAEDRRGRGDDLRGGHRRAPVDRGERPVRADRDGVPEVRRAGLTSVAANRYTITVSSKAKSDYMSLTPADRSRILNAVKEFQKTGKGDIKPIIGTKPLQYRIRVGKMRIIYLPEGGSHVKLIELGYRGQLGWSEAAAGYSLDAYAIWNDQSHAAEHTGARAALPLMTREELRAQGFHTAADDYEQLGEILWERPDLVEAQPTEGMPRRLTLGSKTAERAEPVWLKERRSNPIKDSLNDKKQPWWWRKMVGPALDRYNDSVPPDRQIQDYDDIHKIDSKSWCRFRRKGECYFPKEFDEQGSAEAGYAVWIPFNRGECPWKTWPAQKKDCKVSEPGPDSGERVTYPDATVSWSQGGQRLSSLSETPVTITRKVESAWVDVREKAKRIRQSGGVRVIAVADNSVTGEVRGDTGLYTATVTTVPGSNQVALATCSCPWETYRWARSGPWKKLEGRACAHITALLYEMQARKMFGGEITEDVAAPEWRTEQPALENPKSKPGPWRLDVAASVQGHLAAIVAQRDAMDTRAAVEVHLDPQALSLGLAVANLADDESGEGALVSVARLLEARSLIDIPPFYAQVGGEIVIIDGFDDDGTPWANGRPLSRRQLMYPTFHPTRGITGSLEDKLALYDDLVDLGKVNPDKYDGATTQRKGDWGYYSREQALLDNGFPKGQLFGSEDAMRRYIETVARQEGVTEPVEVTWVWWSGEAGTVWANDWSRARMGFGEGTRYEAVALHELAHLILRKKRKKAPSSHGAEFAAEHARLIKEYMGVTLQTGFNPMDFAAAKSLGVDWFMPGKKRPFATSTRATSDLIVALGEDGHTVQSAHDAILYDPEGKAILAAFIAEGYVNTPLIDLVGGGMVQDQVRKASLAKTAAHSGCMVALVPSPELAAALSIAAGTVEGIRPEPAEEVHLTLAYLGKAADIDKAKFHAAVQGIAAAADRLVGKASGWGTFDNGGEKVLWSSVDVPGLDVLRMMVLEGLTAAGLPVATDHGFTPHMTAGYADEPITVLPSESGAGTPLVFDSIVAAHAGEWTFFDLTDPAGEAIIGETKTAMFEPRPDGEVLAREGEIVYRRKSMLGDNGVEAWLGDSKLVGTLIWSKSTLPLGMIESVDVLERYQRQGIATKMFELAKQIEPRVHHSHALTDDGKAWSKAVGASAQTEYTHAGLVIKAADSGRVLMTQRTPYHADDEETSGAWEFPGGSIEEGETPWVAAVREFAEETGLLLPDDYRIEGELPNGTYIAFLVTVPHESWTVDAELLPLETMGIGWFDPEHVEDSPLTRPEVDETDWEMVKEAASPSEMKDEGDESLKEAKTAVSSQYRYHLTSKVDFKLDPKKHPSNNTTIGGDLGAGIFLSPAGRVEHWLNGYGYWRPWVVEIDVGSAQSDSGKGGYGEEEFYPASEYSKMRIVRVLPLDAFCREQFGSWGWVEEDLGVAFDTGKPIEEVDSFSKRVSWDVIYPFRGWTYSGDARNESSSWQQEYAKKVKAFGRRRGNAIASLDVEAEAEAVLHDEPQPALPEALGTIDAMEPDRFGVSVPEPNTMSPRSEPEEWFEPEESPVLDPVGIQNLGGIDPRVAWLLNETPQSDDSDIAMAAQAALAKMALKTFSIEEQQELIHEGAEDHRGARNTDRLSIAGTHYEYDSQPGGELDLELLW
jgi:8-oxo-dGTP pyrophosphatase MutT (NUDIX family)/2'-5' RNA ligase/mRNA-degrading endonuclease RelE of RelBE toxin-antitoxin system